MHKQLLKDVSTCFLAPKYRRDCIKHSQGTFLTSSLRILCLLTTQVREICLVITVKINYILLRSGDNFFPRWVTKNRDPSIIWSGDFRLPCVHFKFWLIFCRGFRFRPPKRAEPVWNPFEYLMLSCCLETYSETFNFVVEISLFEIVKCFIPRRESARARPVWGLLRILWVNELVA